MKKMTLVTVFLLLIGQAVSAETITPIDEVKRGSMVTVAGTVDRLLDTDEFRLDDGTGKLRIYVGPNWVPATVGQFVTVMGFVDRGFGPKELYARTLTDEEGQMFRFEHRYE